MKKLLLTGFDPFAHYQINPSWEAVRAQPENVGDFKIEKLRLPNIFGLAGRMLLEEAKRLQPDVILLAGMDSGSRYVHMDTVAINVMDALIEDNLGRKPWNETIIAGGPAAYFATLPVHELVRRLRASKYPVQLGYTTGGYVCNDIFYTACHHFAGSATKVGFVHVPLLPEMVWDEKLALPLAESARLLQIIIESLSQLLNEK